jgi:hypothetical protein
MEAPARSGAREATAIVILLCFQSSFSYRICHELFFVRFDGEAQIHLWFALARTPLAGHPASLVSPVLKPGLWQIDLIFGK